MGQSTSVNFSCNMKLTIAFCLTALVVLQFEVIAKPKPKQIKVQLGVHVNSKTSNNFVTNPTIDPITTTTPDPDKCFKLCEPCFYPNCPDGSACENARQMIINYTTPCCDGMLHCRLTIHGYNMCNYGTDPIDCPNHHTTTTTSPMTTTTTTTTSTRKCWKEGEIGCMLAVPKHCCEGLSCIDDGTVFGVCKREKIQPPGIRCKKEGEKGCKLAVAYRCCEGLSCIDDGDKFGLCKPPCKNDTKVDTNPGKCLKEDEKGCPAQDCCYGLRCSGSVGDSDDLGVCRYTGIVVEPEPMPPRDQSESPKDVNDQEVRGGCLKLGQQGCHIVEPQKLNCCEGAICSKPLMADPTDVGTCIEQLIQ